MTAIRRFARTGLVVGAALLLAGTALATPVQATTPAWSPPATSAAAAPAFALQDLGTLGGGSSTGADLNATGQVVGTSRTAGGADHAFLWDPTSRRMVDLGTLGVQLAAGGSDLVPVRGRRGHDDGGSAER